MIRPVQTELLLAIVGKPVEHSLSPLMMNAALRAMKLRAVYLAFEVDEGCIDDALASLSRLGFRGLSVTIPHKQSVFRLAGSLDETARAIGAVNTLRWNGDHWEGRNTDWIGVVQALKGGTPVIAGKRAAVIGAGGAARAVVYGLMREGAAVTVSNRSIGRGKALADDFGAEFIPLADLGRERFDIAIQCTSVGLGGYEIDPPLVPVSFFHPEMVAMDIVYHPVWTIFLLSAKRAGCRVVSGLNMLLHQGVAQLEWWLDQKPPISVMGEVLDKQSGLTVDLIY